MIDIYEYFVVYGDNGVMLLYSWNDCFDVLQHMINGKYKAFEYEIEALGFLSKVKFEDEKFSQLLDEID